MKHITLTAEQAAIVREAGEALDVRDEHGLPLARLTPLSQADIEMILKCRATRAKGNPKIPSAQVQAHLRRLEEIRQSKGMDEVKMKDLLRRMRAGEKV
jgi:antitoxin (DNA-binding transcriptional repressor) of toxin-antitoxin stability system